MTAPVIEAPLQAELGAAYGIASLHSLDHAVIFGVARLGRAMARTFSEQGVPISAFADNDASAWGTSVMGLKVLPPAALASRPPRSVIIASRYVKEIHGQLLALGLGRGIPHYVLSTLFPSLFPNPFHAGAREAVRGAGGEIRRAGELFAEEASRALFRRILRFRQTLDAEDLPDAQPGLYDPGPFWRMDPAEIYVDAGAYTGDTLAWFLERTGGAFRHYAALEPDPENFRKLLAAVPPACRDRVTALCAGAGEKAGTVSFNNTGLEDAAVGAGGGLTIPVIPLDELPLPGPPTTLKIDVEGYEPEVVRGARTLLALHRPKLALCAYHRPRHLWELPLLVHGLNPGYTLYLRHHEPEIYGTVLYAV